VRLKDATDSAVKGVAEAVVRDSVLGAKQRDTDKRVDSLLIELRHLPDAVADTLAARERRSR
jgi:hypothetical protein